MRPFFRNPMQVLNYTTQHKKLLADTYTPLGIYMQLRDVFINSIMLESSDYHAAENSYSYICFQPLAYFKTEAGIIEIQPYHQPKIRQLLDSETLFSAFDTFSNAFNESNNQSTIANGLFGYAGFDNVKFFDKHLFETTSEEIPLLYWTFYRFIIRFDHFRDELTIYENIPEDEETQIERIISLIKNKNVAAYPFTCKEKEESNVTNEEFVEVVKKGIKHCFRGDVFQIVLSRRFTRSFTGDELNVYRALRSVNPSPYLFYFDYGNFKIFGSSPEAQLVVKNNEAVINPIAGTFKRTGNDVEDRALAEKLASDPKENAEHVMLVDLARNDLSKHSNEVTVNKYKQIQFYSHVIHLVSEVKAKLKNKVNPLRLLADSFPAGTLSGAPKHKAIELIKTYENISRGFYGGCIGHIGFNGDINTAITIRTFLSKGSKLHYQAGAGVVAASNPQSELEEVNNKLGALRKAVELAQNI